MKFLLFVLCLLFISTSGNTAIVSTQKPSSQSSLNKTPLRIIVKPIESYTLQNEPVVLEVTLKNQSTKTLYIAGDLEPKYNVLTYNIWNEDTNESVYRSPTESGLFFPLDYKGVEINPGSSYVVWADVTWRGWEDTPIDKPEHFKIKASYTWQNKETKNITDQLSAESKEIDIVMNPPEGIDLEAFRLLSQANQLRFTRLNLKEKERIYRNVLSLYPKSRYARYAHAKLADILETVAYINKDPLYFKLAIEALHAIPEKYSRFGFTDYAKEREAWVIYQSGNKSEALKRYNLLLADPLFPDSLKRSIKFTINDVINKDMMMRMKE